MKKRFWTIFQSVSVRAALLACALALITPAAPVHAADAVGPVTGLPLPRFASLKSDRVNLREGPSKDHRTTWVFQRAGLPVEIMAEFETWRRIRDAEGTEGWVLHSLLSGRRTALVSPWLRGDKVQPVAIFDRADDRGGIVARLSPGVLGSVRSCDGSWCRIGGQGGAGTEFDGYIRQDRLWGAYPNERID
jgi:SH3-like domain-containing protein